MAVAGNGFGLPRLSTSQRLALTLLSTDSGVTVMDTDIQSLMTWNGLFWVAGSQQFNVKAFGAVGDGVTDDSAAIQSAATACSNAGGLLYFPFATYRVNSTITISCDVDNSGASLQWDTGFSGIGVQIGVTSGSSTLYGKSIRLPNLIHSGAYTSRISGDIGCRITNVYSSKIEFGSVNTGWNIAVWLGGVGGGFAYNIVNVGRHYDNLIHLKLQPTGSGWVNQNIFNGGSLTSTSTYGDRPGVDNGSRYLVLGGNNNIFIGPSFEGASAYYFIEVTNSNNNSIENARIEKAYTNGVQILTDATGGNTTVNNKITVLYFSCSGQTFPTLVTGSSGGTVYPVALAINTHLSLNGWESSGRGLLTLQNQQASGNSSLSVYPLSTDISANPGNWQMSVSGSATKWKTDTDTFPKLQVNHTLGWIQFGSGAGVTDLDFYRNSAGVLRTNGSMIFDSGVRIGLAGTTISRSIHGSAVMVAGTITVANSNITASTRIFVTVKTPGGTQGFLSTSRSVGVSFTITSTNVAETSTIEYLLIEP